MIEIEHRKAARQWLGAVLLGGVVLLAASCGTDEPPGAAGGGDSAATTPLRQQQPDGELECEDIITFEQLSELTGLTFDRCEDGGFFRSSAPAMFNIREDPGGSGSNDGTAQGAGWSGRHTESICALRAAVGERRFLVQVLQQPDDVCAPEVREAIMDAIAARHG